MKNDYGRCILGMHDCFDSVEFINAIHIIKRL